MTRLLRELWQDTKGNALAIFAAALVPLVVVIGSGLDLSFAYMAKAKLQNACDAAVLAGRQHMDGNAWTNKDETEARKFFDFNFPSGTLGAQSLQFAVDKDPNDNAQIVGSASAVIPTSLMFIFGYDDIPVQANCDAKRDLGHNDVMLVLDVTGSMDDPPSIGGDKKIKRLQTGAAGLYRALYDSSGNSITRFGIMPYSHTVNVGRSLQNRDIIKEQLYYGYWTYEYCDSDGRYYWDCVTQTSTDRPNTGLSNGNKKYTHSRNYVRSEHYVHINRSTWNLGSGGTDNANIQGFRTSGIACIQERSSVGNGDNPIDIKQTVSQDDIDLLPKNANDTKLQYGRYDPAAYGNSGTTVVGGLTRYIVDGVGIQNGCPAEASKLQKYADVAAFNKAISDATAKVTGGTYHDIGMLWGARFISRTGMFSGDNKTEISGVPVNQHIVFMTDGKLDTGGKLYTAYGIDDYQDRIDGYGSLDSKHIARFDSICDRVKSTNVTVWVIAFDVTDTDDIEDCATSSAHFYTTDGSDLESIFERIGRGIGNLRLTR